MTDNDGFSIGQGAVLYDTRKPMRRPCCSRGGRCLAHVTNVYEDIHAGSLLYEMWDGTHTTREYINGCDLLSTYDLAGWQCPTGTKPTHLLTRQHGVIDHHDRMQEASR